MPQEKFETAKPETIEPDTASRADQPVPDAERVGGAGRGAPQKPGERGGPEGPEPTRFGDWETGGRCTDF